MAGLRIMEKVKPKSSAGADMLQSVAYKRFYNTNMQNKPKTSFDRF